MKVPPDAIIADDKLTRYLLKPRPADDKSGYLALAGFHAGNPRVLEAAIRALAQSGVAAEDGRSAYGIFWKVIGELVGPGGRALPAVLIWMERHDDGQFHLVTLRPPKTGERRAYVQRER